MLFTFTMDDLNHSILVKSLKEVKLKRERIRGFGDFFIFIILFLI